ncbi:heterokaryon incompatibility protein Het-C-domain-containing protein [Bombardia bombarda]|uniref:Heterokaryon incompatibility protein Het-C-domain-containing protein n=1 Tax=Bombardia bombarda TaxID=252184 RepID=A0AA39XA28_9PEZI|nr:heterokaryon incompatibility protein Het-C-domain-containing protein [Bombardia bombarda]
MAISNPFPVLLGLVILFAFVQPTLAFGAGNIAGISSVEGQNWRHGDIEDALLKILMARAVGGKKFDKIMVSRVYFGNWLRDYSQAIDVGTVKSVSAEAIRLLLCVLGFLTFGYGSREFEVTAERLGCYRPEDHIDNPKNYADNEDATQYDRRLRGRVDEGVELAIDSETGMKNYIANEGINIMTSAQHVRTLFTKCIELGRSYQNSRDKAELYESLRVLGTGLHCLEDFLAHSNYVELALIEMGERDVFPHVGRNTKLRLNGARGEVYPCVTGTFGGVDFLHSVTGEVSDKLTQSEIQDLEGTLEASKKADTSILRNLLDKIPDGMFNDDKKGKIDQIQENANNSQLANTSVSPRDPEEFTKYVQQIFQQIMPAIQYHDEVLQSIAKAIENIPILPKILEQLEEQLSLFVFSVIAPFVIPVIDQVKNELATGATEVIESSKNEQHIVFNDDSSSDPTHSMLSKDHFSNILNEIAGQTASKVVTWVVPQLMAAIDDQNTDIDRLLNKVIFGVLHHPAQRDQGPDGAREGRSMMYKSVEEWWNNMDDSAKDEYRQKLSREGVERGDNHKEGVHDSGHGCGGKLGMHKNFGGKDATIEDQIAGAAASAIIGGVTSGFSNLVEDQTGMKLPQQPSRRQEESSGGLGGLIGGLLGGGFKNEETDTYQSGGRTEEGGYEQTTSQYGRQGNRYGQAEVTETQFPGGEERTQYNRYEQNEDTRQETRYEQTTETSSYGRQSSRREEETSSYGGGGRRQEESYEEETTSSYGGGGRGGYGGGRGEREESSEGRYGGGRRQEESYGEEEETTSSYGGGGGGYGSGRGAREASSESRGGRGGREESYGDGYGGGRGGREDSSEGRYGGGRQEESYGGNVREESYGSREETYGGGRREESGEREESSGGGFGDFIGGIAKQLGDNGGEEEEEQRRW